MGWLSGDAAQQERMTVLERALESCNCLRDRAEGQVDFLTTMLRDARQELEDVKAQRVRPEGWMREREALHRQNAVLQTTVEFLQDHVNRLYLERQALMERILGITGVPSPEYAVQPEPIAPPDEQAADEKAIAAQILGVPRKSTGDAINTRRDAREQNPLELEQALAAVFEDMGDEAAAALGVETDAEGRVRYRT